MDKAYLTLSDFKYEIYRDSPGLVSMTNEELEIHYLTHGIIEGRLFNAISNRKDFIRNIDSKKGKMLEIGPLDNPQLDYKSPDYYSLDIFSKEELINNYFKDITVNKDKIIEPSYVIADNDYSAIKQKFKCIFSSHNIEHMPCVVTFLNNLESILDDDGYIYLVIPDKRYCFDYFKKETDIYDVLQLYYEKNHRPRLSDVLRTQTQITHSDCQAHWNDDHGMIYPEVKLLRHYQDILNLYNTGGYIDAHVSCFTPQSFIEIINILIDLNLIKLEIHKIYHTLKGANEFYVILKRENW
jgi:hypothetical protein